MNASLWLLLFVNECFSMVVFNYSITRLFTRAAARVIYIVNVVDKNKNINSLKKKNINSIIRTYNFNVIIQLQI